MESWMVSIAVGILTIAVAWGYNKATVSNLSQAIADVKKELKEHSDKGDKIHVQESEHHEALHKDFTNRINSGFKRLDDVAIQVTVLERDTATHLTMQKAEVKFVSKAELALHLKNIELKTEHIDKSVSHIMGKQEDMMNFLSKNLSNREG